MSDPQPAITPLDPFANEKVGGLDYDPGGQGRDLRQGIAVVIAIAVLGFLVFLLTFAVRTTKVNAGSITKIVAVAQEGSSAGQESHRSLVGIQVTIQNPLDKAVKVYSEKAVVTPATGEPLSDEAAASVELPRYQQAFPDLRQLTAPGIPADTMIPAHGKLDATMVFGFAMAKDAFDKRKNLKIVIVLDSEDPLVLSEHK